MRKVIFGTLITIVLVGSVLLFDHSMRLNRPVPTNSGAAKMLPTDVSFQKFPGGETTDFSKYKGKVVLINFWASWCEACMAEMPSIQKLYDEMKGEGLEVLAMNVDENPGKVVPGIVTRLKLNFPIFSDPSGALSRAFEVVAIPFNVVADRQQRIIWSESGERDWSSPTVKMELRKLLTGARQEGARQSQ